MRKTLDTHQDKILITKIIRIKSNNDQFQMTDDSEIISNHCILKPLLKN